MWCNPWIIKEAVRPIICVLVALDVCYWSLWAFAKITYKMHKMGKIK